MYIVYLYCMLFLVVKLIFSLQYIYIKSVPDLVIKSLNLTPGFPDFKVGRSGYRGKLTNSINHLKRKLLLDFPTLFELWASIIMPKSRQLYIGLNLKRDRTYHGWMQYSFKRYFFENNFPR